MANVMAAFAYLLGWMSGLVVFVISKDDKMAKFHGLQSLLFNLLFTVVGVIVAIPVSILYFIWLTLQLMNQGLLALIAEVLTVLPFMLYLAVFFLAWLWVMWQAFNNRAYKLPLIGNWAEKWSG